MPQPGLVRFGNNQIDAVTQGELAEILDDYPSSEDVEDIVDAALADYPDPSDIVTESELNTALSDYTTTSDVTAAIATALTDYVTNALLASTLASYVTAASLASTLASYALDNAVVHIAGNGTTPEEITGVKDFSYGHGGAQDDNNPSVRAARLRITGQVAPTASQKSVSQVDFYIDNDNIAYMGCTRQNGATYVKVASNNDSVPLIFGYKPFQDNTACIRFEKNHPVWRGGQTGTYSADKDLAVVGDIKSGTYTLINKTISVADNTINGFTASKALVSDANGKIAVSGVTATELGYLSGVTSNVQDQLDDKQDQIDAKQDEITGAASSIASTNLTASKALVSDANGKVAASNVTATELGCLSGVTSSLANTATITFTFTDNTTATYNVRIV